MLSGASDGIGPSTDWITGIGLIVPLGRDDRDGMAAAGKAEFSALINWVTAVSGRPRLRSCWTMDVKDGIATKPWLIWDDNRLAMLSGASEGIGPRTD
jgi:hypothetical protein